MSLWTPNLGMCHLGIGALGLKEMIPLLGYHKSYDGVS